MVGQTDSYGRLRVAFSGGAGIIYKGGIDCSGSPNYPAATSGDLYVVTAGGNIGGAAGPVVEAGDQLFCKTNSAAGDEATVGANWDIVQTNIDIDGYVNKTTTDMDIYISTTGDDTTGDGSVATPYATRQHVYDKILPTVIDDEITIHLAAGTYYESAILAGKIIGEGYLRIQGEIDVLNDNGGANFTITAGDIQNATGFGELTVATAGWTPNAYDGKWIEIIETDGVNKKYGKYIPIYSNSATVITTTQLGFTPTIGTTEFKIVDLTTIISGASAAHPNVAQDNETQGLEIIDNISTAVSGVDVFDSDDFYRQPLTYAGLVFQNSDGYPIQVYGTSFYAEGVSGYASTAILTEVNGDQAGVTQITVDSTAEMWVGMCVTIGSNLYKYIESIDDATHFTITGAAISVSDNDDIERYSSSYLFYAADYSSGYIYGSIITGDMSGIVTANKKSSISVNYHIGNYEDVLTGTKVYAIEALDNSFAQLNLFIVYGKVGSYMNSVGYAYGPGSYVYVYSGRADYVNRIVRAGGTGYGIAGSTTGLFGDNVTYLYTAKAMGNIYGVDYTNIVATKDYDLDDSGRIYKGGLLISEDIYDATIAIASGTISPNNRKSRLTAGAAYTMTSTPTITAGEFEGQQLTLIGTSNTNTITLQDNTVLAGSLLNLRSRQDMVLSDGDFIELTWMDVGGTEMWQEGMSTGNSRTLADVYTVAARGGDYSSIQDALDDNTTGGETFLIYPGSYADTIAFTADNQIIKSVGWIFNVAVGADNSALITVGDWDNCTIEGFSMAVTAPTTALAVISVNDGNLIIKDSLVVMTVAASIATASQPSIVKIAGSGEVAFKDSVIGYDNDGAEGTAIKVPFIIDADGYISVKGSKIDVDNTNATSVSAVASFGGNGELDVENSSVSVDDEVADYVIGSGYVTSGIVEQSFVRNKISVSRTGAGAADVAAFYASGAAAASVGSASNKIRVSNTTTPARAYSFYQAGTPTVNSYLDNLKIPYHTSGTINFKNLKVSLLQTGTLQADDISVNESITLYDATNDGNPEIRLGASDAEEFHVQTYYDAGTQLIDFVLFMTDTAGVGADKGKYKFNVDGADIFQILDAGIAVTGGATLSGNLNVGGGKLANITEVTTAAYNILSTGYFISDQYTDTGAAAVTLPAISADNDGQVYIVKDADYNASVNTLTINKTGGDTIDEAATATITTDGASLSFIANNTTKNWEIF